MKNKNSHFSPFGKLRVIPSEVEGSKLISQNCKASALLYVMLLIATVGTIALGAARFMVVETKISTQSTDSITASWLAEAGLEEYLYQYFKIELAKSTPNLNYEEPSGATSSSSQFNYKILDTGDGTGSSSETGNINPQVRQYLAKVWDKFQPNPATQPAVGLLSFWCPGTYDIVQCTNQPLTFARVPIRSQTVPSFIPVTFSLNFNVISNGSLADRTARLHFQSNIGQYNNKYCLSTAYTAGGNCPTSFTFTSSSDYLAIILEPNPAYFNPVASDNRVLSIQYQTTSVDGVQFDTGIKHFDSYGTFGSAKEKVEVTINKSSACPNNPSPGNPSYCYYNRICSRKEL